MSLTVGHIDYLNCVPFFHFLHASGFSGDIVKGVPSELNRLLASADLDVCPSSSFEYGLHWRDYLLLPDLSISARGKVGSVLLISPQPPEALTNVPIALTGESATSINLLRVLLREYYGLDTVSDYVPQSSVESVIARGEPALLIGDRALKAATQVEASTVYDLGALWNQHTGKAFVFALWMVRREVAEQSYADVHTLSDALHRSLQRAWEELTLLGDVYAESHWMHAPDLCNYWQMMDYRLGQQHLQGLELYFELCCKYHLLDTMPQIHFFDANNR